MKHIFKYIPNTLTLFRLFLGLSIPLFYFIEHELFWVQTIVIVGIISDKLDGTFARITDNESELGKKLESITDPTFTFFVGWYLFFFTNFPHPLFYLMITIFFIGSLWRIIIKIKSKKLFYEKSQITRYGVGATFIIMLLYLFEVPYREWVIWPYTLLSFIGAGNYFRLLWNFTKRENIFLHSMKQQ